MLCCDILQANWSHTVPKNLSFSFSSERGEQAWNKWPEGSPSVYALQIAGHTLSGLSNYTKTKTLTHPPLFRKNGSPSILPCPDLLSWRQWQWHIHSATQWIFLVLFLFSLVKPHSRCDSHRPLTKEKKIICPTQFKKFCRLAIKIWPLSNWLKIFTLAFFLPVTY